MTHHKKRGFFPALVFMLMFGGSAGIFHKANFILDCAEGNVAQGVIAIVLGGMTAFFGCLALNQLCSQTAHGGLINIYEQFCGKKLACGYGWFSTFVSTPSIIAVLSWVAGIYTLNLMGEPAEGIAPILIGIGYVTIMVLLNLISHTAALHTQRVSSVIKIFPFLFLGIYGLFFADSTLIPVAQESTVEVSLTPSPLGWLCAMAPVAFCFENWFTVTTYAKHSGNKRVNWLSAISVTVITLVYVCYFVGISGFGEQILAYHNSHLWVIIEAVFNNQWFSVIVMLFVLFAILGTVDTLVMGQIHMPDIMSDRGMLSRFWGKNTMKKNIPVASIILGYALILAWMVVHILLEEGHIFTADGTPETDVAEISMIVTFALLIVLYLQIIRMYFKKELKNAFLCVVCPILAITGTLLFVAGGILNNVVSFTVCAVLWVLCFFGGWLYYKVKVEKEGEKGDDLDSIEKTDLYVE